MSTHKEFLGKLYVGGSSKGIVCSKGGIKLTVGCLTTDDTRGEFCGAGRLGVRLGEFTC